MTSKTGTGGKKQMMKEHQINHKLKQLQQVQQHLKLLQQMHQLVQEAPQ